MTVAAWRGPMSYSPREDVRSAVLQTLAALPLCEGFITPGNRVVLKPNWVKEHDERKPGPDQWEHVVTHPSVIEAVADWVGDKLQGQGTVTICDAPQTDSSFRKLAEYCGFQGMIDRLNASHPGVHFILLDLRPEEWHAVDGVVVSKTLQAGDPLGSTQVSLNESSEFVDFAGQGKLYGASYDMQETNDRHVGSRHDYLLCRTPLDADVFINLPKLKTHKKVGVTCALKNLVGINANKNWLPHHTEGTPDQGGDQFPVASTKARLEQNWMGTAKRWLKNSPVLSRLFVPVKKLGRLYFGDTQTVVRSGNWHGNDTCWRMVLDLNKCLFSFNGEGQPRSKPIRYLAVVDGIIGGEGNGPMAPDAKPTGVIIAGTHPAAVDTVAATLMGFNWQKIRLLKNVWSMARLSFCPFGPESIRIVSNDPHWQGGLQHITPVADYRPHFGWVGAIELEKKTPIT